MPVLDEGGLGSYWDGRVGVQVGKRAGALLVLVSDSTRLLCNEPQEQVRIPASILEGELRCAYVLAANSSEEIEHVLDE